MHLPLMLTPRPFLFSHCLTQIETKTALAQDQDPKIFPDEISGMQETVITCLDITNDFLCYATDVCSPGHNTFDNLLIEMFHFLSSAKSFTSP
jgi:hypothetical protein